MSIHSGNGTTDPKLAVFVWDKSCCGERHLRQLLEDTANRILRAQIVAVVSNEEHRLVHALTERHGIPFFHFGHPWTAQRYQLIAEQVQADYYFFFRWFKPICGLNLRTRFNPRTVFGIYPANTTEFDREHHTDADVHAVVLDAFNRNEVTSTAVTMFYLSGPVVFKGIVGIDSADTPVTLAERMDFITRKYVSAIADRVVNGQLHWNGKDADSLTHPNFHLFSIHVDIPTQKDLQNE